MASTTKISTDTAKSAKKPIKKQIGKVAATSPKPKKALKKTEEAGKPSKAARSKSTKITKTIITSEERHRMIAEAAYYLAEKRGFQSGSSDCDWYQAAEEIDNKIINA